LQGANDTDKFSGEAAKAWASSFAAMVSDLRRDLSTPDLAVVIGVIGDPTGIADSSHWSTVQAQQRSIRLDRFACIETDDLATKPGDCIHLPTASLVTFGERGASAMAKLLRLSHQL
jgi:hypothetical protein